MEAILLEKVRFDITDEQDQFQRVFNSIERVAGETAFCKFANNKPTGGLAPAHFEAIAIAFSQQLVKVDEAPGEVLDAAIIAARQTSAFRDNVGPGANNRTKLAGRIKAISDAIAGA